ENEVGKGVAQLIVRAHDDGGRIHQIGVQLDDRATLLRQIAPARLGELERAADETVEIDARQRRLALLRAIELSHAAHGRRDVMDRCLDGVRYARARSLNPGSRSSSDSV